MVKIIICDLHRAKGQIVETTRYMKVAKHPELKMDLCTECMNEVEKLSMKEYVKLVYKTTTSIDFDKEPGMAELIYKQLNIR